MIYNLVIKYVDNDVALQTQQFNDIESVKQHFLNNKDRNIMIYDVNNQGHLLETNFNSVSIEWIDENGIAQNVIADRNNEAIENIKVNVNEVETNVKEIEMSDVNETNETIIPEILSDNETLPEIPTKFKGFRDFFQEQNRLRNTWLNAIAEKMAKANELLKCIDEKLDQENISVEELQKRFIGK